MEFGQPVKTSLANDVRRFSLQKITFLELMKTVVDVYKLSSSTPIVFEVS